MPGIDRSEAAQSSRMCMQTGLRGRAASRSSLCTSRWRKSGPASVSALASSESPFHMAWWLLRERPAYQGRPRPHVLKTGGERRPRSWHGLLGLSMGVWGMLYNLQHPARFLLGQA